ncbi:MAG: ABC transporter ATP-binding protein [Chloroflexi bacterium]|nr:ABC transporter ATP-binding protein [Chloroflexota bacterium]
MMFGEHGSGDEVRALQNVSLEIRPRELVSLIGPSGCGKSTLLRLIGDLLTPTGGTLTVNGKTPRQARLDRDYGIVFQQPVLYDWRTVEANVQLPLEVMKAPREERQRRSRELLELVGLHEFASRYPWELSGGMQQRVSIARALSIRPSVLLMDEPFGALDEMTRERLNHELLNVWAETGTTLVFVTHSIAEAVFLSDRIVVMSPRPGRVETVIEVDLPRPRTAETREDRHFFELIAEVRHNLREVDRHEG